MNEAIEHMVATLGAGQVRPGWVWLAGLAGVLVGLVVARLATIWREFSAWRKQMVRRACAREASAREEERRALDEEFKLVAAQCRRRPEREQPVSLGGAAAEKAAAESPVARSRAPSEPPAVPKKPPAARPPLLIPPPPPPALAAPERTTPVSAARVERDEESEVLTRMWTREAPTVVMHLSAEMRRMARFEAKDGGLS
jgi:hypothetical protein